MYTSSTLESNY